MAYDEHLAARIRALLEGDAGLTEKKMFGGLAFLIGGNMAVAASGGAVCWCALTRRPPTTCSRRKASRPMEMRGRQMRGWLRVDDEAVRTERQLKKWVQVGAGYARTLPPKR